MEQSERKPTLEEISKLIRKVKDWRGKVLPSCPWFWATIRYSGEFDGGRIDIMRFAENKGRGRYDFGLTFKSDSGYSTGYFSREEQDGVKRIFNLVDARSYHKTTVSGERLISRKMGMRWEKLGVGI